MRNKLLYLYIVVTAALFASVPIDVNAQYSGYVGDYVNLPGPSGRAGYDVYDYAFGSFSWNLDVSRYGSVRIVSYFEGSEQVFCDVTYVRQYIVAGRMYQDMQTGRQYYTITCRPRYITGLPSNVTLSVGESKSLSWSFSPYSSTADVDWYTDDSNIATVTSGGKIKGVSPGTAVITAKNNSGPDEYIYVTVLNVDPTGVSLPSTASVNIEESITLTPTLTPSNAVSDFTWESENPSIATVSGGKVTGVSVGTTDIKVTTVKGGYTAKSRVTVSEPPFTFKEFSISNGATGIDVLTTITATYSHTLSRGARFTDITFTDGSGKQVDGDISISDKQLSFKPKKALSPLTNYKFTIPAGAVNNKWGTSFASSQSVSFTTRDWEKLLLDVSPDTKFVEAGTQITLTANVKTAKIYYTTDGNPVSNNSKVYNSPIAMSKAMTLRAIAKLDGYYDSPELKRDFYVSNVNVTSRFPGNEPLYIYDDVNPRIAYSNQMVKGEKFDSITFTKNGIEKVACEKIVNGNRLTLVPSMPLNLGCVYKITIPEGALNTIQGEPCKSDGWTFNTGNFAIAASTGSQELGTAVMSDGSLWTWGMVLKEANTSNGSYSYETLDIPKQFVASEVKTVATGFTHNALLKYDNSLWMWGRQLCGEFGNESTAASAQPLKVADDINAVSLGLQTTAVIYKDGTLWMCGRNDYGQIGDSTRTNKNAFVKVMDNVSVAVAGWNATYAIKSDGTLWSWGCNDYGQLGDGTQVTRLLPVKVMDGVKMVSAKGNNAAAVKTDGSLWLWGDNSYGQINNSSDSLSKTPVNTMNGVSSVSIGDGSVMVVTTDGSLKGWGRNTYGQLGDGTDNNVKSPVSIISNVSTIEQGWQNTIAMKQDGSVWTWGLNNRGVLGNGTPSSQGVYSCSPHQTIEGRSPQQLTGAEIEAEVLELDISEKAVVPMRPKPLLAEYTHTEWISSNPAVAAVDERGVIKASAYGETSVTVTLSTATGQTAKTTCRVVVKDPRDVDERIINVSSAGYATFFDSRQHFSLPDGLSASVVISATDKKLTYKKIAEGGTNNKTIPKGVAVMISSNVKRAATYTLKSESTAPEFHDNNMLSGTDEASKTKGTGYHYKLAYGPSDTKWSNVFGWYWGADNGGAFQIEGHKAWLVVPKSSGTRGFTIDGDATGIINVNHETIINTSYYDLQGRSVIQPAKGVYIKNGKKVVVK